MKKTLILLTLFLSLNSLSASLKMTKEKTDSLEKDAKYIKYKKEKHEKMDESSYIQFSDLGYGVKDLKAITGLSNINVYASNKPTKEIDDAHTSKMIKSFKNAVGEDWFFRNKDRYYIMSSFTNPRWWSGIIVNSKFGVYGGRSYLSGDGIYFGNVINEVLLGRNGSRRVFTDNTDNRNLFITALDNSEDEDDYKFHNTSGTKIGDIVVPTTETMIFPSFGSEAQKLIRSDKIFVGEYICRNDREFEWEFEVPKRIAKNDKRESNYSEDSYTCNFAASKGEMANFALYNRAAAVISNGEIKAVNKYSHGSSYATPKVGGYASLIQEKFPNMNYMQIKQVLLTTAYRPKDELSNIAGWGAVDIEKALKGPSSFNAGLIEEEKFYTGRYDKIFDKKGNIYFYADVKDNDKWEWSNDIDGGLTSVPSNDKTYNFLVNYDKYKITTEGKEKSVIENMNIKAVLPSEYNYYEKLSKYNTGLRKAGTGTLITTGDLNYKGPTQVLEGTLEIDGDVITSPIWVFENAILVLDGQNQTLKEVNADGGLIKVYGKVHINELAMTSISDIKLYGKDSELTVDKFISTKEKAEKLGDIQDVELKKVSEVNEKWGANDVVINEYKVVDLPREFYLSNFGNELKKFDTNDSYEKMYEKLKKRYTIFRDSDESIKIEVPGYKNGVFAIEKDADYAGFDPREYSDNMIGVISSQDDLKSIDSDFNFIPLDEALKDAKK